MKKHINENIGREFDSPILRSNFNSNVCLQDRKVFLGEQRTYSPEEMKIHLKKGDADTKVIHHYCDFCGLHLFDNDKLYEHLNEKHQLCTLCHKNGKQFQYYNDYKSLVRNFVLRKILFQI